MKILISNVKILSEENKNGFNENCCIMLEDDRISYVGDESQCPKEYEKVVHGGGMLALPGFINTHTHAAMNLFKGFANDLPLFDWLKSLWPLEDKLKGEDIYWLTMMAISEMIKCGVTCFSDMYMFMTECAEAVKETGIRAVLARGLQSGDTKEKTRLREGIRLFDEWNNRCSGRITVMLGPHAIYTCSSEYLKECIKAANSLKCGIHIHLAETKKEFDDCMQDNKCSPVKYVYDLGLLENKVVSAHCVHVTEEDMELLKETNTSVSHCPVSNLKLASGIAPVTSMMQKGICVSLGTDGSASNNNLSVLKEMQTASLIAKYNTKDATALDALTVLKMSSEDGAKALKLDCLGKIKPGYKADIVLLDVERQHYKPINYMPSALAYSAMSTDVDTVIVNGKVLMKNRILTTIDTSLVNKRVKKIQDKIF